MRESVELIRSAGAMPAAVLIALDRMERAGPDDALSPHSAVQEVSRLYGIPVIAIANLNDLFECLSGANAESSLSQFKDAVGAYRAKYGTV